MKRTTAAVAAVLTLLGLALVSPVLPGAPVPASAVPSPLVGDRDLADPSVTRVGRGYVVVATGSRVRREHSLDGRRWRSRRPLLSRLPRWASRGGHIWAPELVKVRGRWLLYYAAPVAGLGSAGHCIGVARAHRPRGTFRPVGRRPLVCPARARTPRAFDIVRGGRGLPKTGAIDPSLFRARGQLFLLYKTSGTPSELRRVKLHPGGLRTARRARSRPLVRSHGIIENPVVVRRGGRWLLITSEGDFAGCDYRTTWRSSRDLRRWSRPRLLLGGRSSRLCGPGGADVVHTGGRTMLYFHAWVCQGGTRPCPSWFRVRRHAGGVRGLYAARLEVGRRVRVTGFVHRLTPAQRLKIEKRRAARKRAERHAHRRREVRRVARHTPRSRFR